MENKCNGRCYECNGCEDLELQIYTEILLHSLGIDCETTHEKMKNCLAESERLGALIDKKSIDEPLRAKYRANRITCNVQFATLVGTLNRIEWTIKKQMESLDDGAETGQANLQP